MRRRNFLKAPAEQANRIDDRSIGHVRQRMTRDLNAWIKKYSS